jgi:hypothetical protein
VNADQCIEWYESYAKHEAIVAAKGAAAVTEVMTGLGYARAADGSWKPVIPAQRTPAPATPPVIPAQQGA